MISPDVTRHQAELEQLCRTFHVRRLELFGSAATGRERPGESDLDFLVEFEPIPNGAAFNTYFDFRQALEELFNRSVDLVMDSAIKNPYFRRSVDESKVLIYAA